MPKTNNASSQGNNVFFYMVVKNSLSFPLSVFPNGEIRYEMLEVERPFNGAVSEVTILGLFLRFFGRLETTESKSFRSNLC